MFKMRFPILRLILALVTFILGVQAQYYAPPPSSSSSSSPYTLSKTYDQTNFFQEFIFFTAGDPTHGFVQYVDGQTAKDAGLAGVSEGAVYMGVDHTTKNPTNGRRSVRLTSSQPFTQGLFVADIAHMPGGACGVWPAYWMFGADWPRQGEIDIIEGVSHQLKNQVTLHTNPGCVITNNGSALTTSLVNPDCNSLVRNNEGCAQKSDDVTSYGDGFNAIGGGVYATEWTSTHIAVWFFPRWRIPSDITNARPSPSSWGPPMAMFNGGQGCDIDQYFQSNNLVFDTTFCGDWAGNAWGGDLICSGLANTCQEYVASEPEAFSEAYWLVNSIKVYSPRTNSFSRRHRHGSLRA